ncbi:hypothetical protein CTA2_2230, partial [Colletotrichum tanaceti]
DDDVPGAFRLLLSLLLRKRLPGKTDQLLLFPKSLSNRLISVHFPIAAQCRRRRHTVRSLQAHTHPAQCFGKPMTYAAADRLHAGQSPDDSRDTKPAPRTESQLKPCSTFFISQRPVMRACLCLLFLPMRFLFSLALFSSTHSSAVFNTTLKHLCTSSLFTGTATATQHPSSRPDGAPNQE